MDPEDDCASLFSVDLRRPVRPDPAIEAMRRRLKQRLFGEVLPDVQIGRFRLVETLGQGGMGVVYAADDAELDRRVALKLIRADHLRDGSRDRLRLLREARMQAKLSDPHVVQIHEVSEYEHGLFIVMELVRGPTLRQWLDSAAHPLSAILDRFVEAARGLSAAHRAGIVHRDFKLTNALVGEDGRVRLVDFGLALGVSGPVEASAATANPVSAAREPSISSATRRRGTPTYMSPEQVLGVACDARSDQYSFCVALVEALCGCPPVPAQQRLAQPERGSVLPPGRRAPRWLRNALTRGLALRPDDRFPSMDALIDVLVNAPRRRRRRFAAAGVALALTAATALGAAARGADPPELCPDPGIYLENTWDEPRRRSLRDAFMATGLEYAETSWRRTSANLDEYAARWTATSLDNCEATRLHRTQSEQAFDRSARCLAHAHASWTTLLDVLAAADVPLVAHAEVLVAGLPAPERCRNSAVMHADDDDSRPDRDDAAQRSLLERADILIRTEQGPQAAALLAGAIARFRAVDDSAHEAEALLLLGKAQCLLLSDGPGALESLHRAYDRAATSGRTDLMWSIWTELARAHARLLGKPAEARTWLTHARNSRPPHSPIADAALLTAESEILHSEGHDTQSLDRRQAALTILRAYHPAGHPEIVQAQLAIAVMLAEVGRVVEARDLSMRLLPELWAQFGRDHPWPARAELYLGLDLLDLGKLAQARLHLEHARAVIAATYGPIHASAAHAELALAQLDAAEGHQSQAIARAEAALAAFDATVPATHRNRIATLTLLSALYLESEQIAPQLAVSRALLAAHDHGAPARYFDLPGVLTNIGNCLCDLGRCSDALPYFTRLMSLYVDEPPDDPLFAAVPLRGIGLVHVERDEHALALTFLEQAFDKLERAHERGGVADLRAATARELADVLAALGRSPRRVQELRRLAKALDASP